MCERRVAEIRATNRYAAVCYRRALRGGTDIGVHDAEKLCRKLLFRRICMTWPHRNPKLIRSDNYLAMGTEVDAEVKHLEVIDNVSRSHQQFYKPVTDEEKALDRRVNLKLDFCVVAILAINFIVSISAKHIDACPLIKHSCAVSTRPMSVSWPRALFRTMQISNEMTYRIRCLCSLPRTFLSNR